jgi:RNA polymerase sigma-70 factor, ECF subfamily
MAAGLELGRYIESGDLRAAGDWLVRQYASDVVSLCRAIVRERATAEDLAQDAFSAAFTGLSSFRREASPRTWLLAITRNRCIDHLRRLSRDPWRGAELEEPDPDAQPDDAPLPAEIVLQRADVDAALSSLAEAERAIVVLRFRHGLEYPEIASVFGLREGTVRMRLSRALAKMRSELETVDRVTHAFSSEPDADTPPASFADARPGPRDLLEPPRPAARPAAMRMPVPASASPPPPRAVPAPAATGRMESPVSAAPARASWWTRLLERLGVRRPDPLLAPGDDDEPSPELRGRLAVLVRGLPSR